MLECKTPTSLSSKVAQIILDVQYVLWNRIINVNSLTFTVTSKNTIIQFHNNDYILKKKLLMLMLFLSVHNISISLMQVNNTQFNFT